MVFYLKSWEYWSLCYQLKVHSDEDNEGLDSLDGAEEEESQCHAPVENRPAHPQHINEQQIIQKLKHKFVHYSYHSDNEQTKC